MGDHTSALGDTGPHGLSASRASTAQSRLALGTVMVSAVLFVLLAPFAKQPLAQVWPFIPVYQSALVVNDLITAVLLFGQFHILRRPALLVLAGGYLFTAAMALLHMLSFPGLFAPGGLLGAGPQSTAWMYMFWHAGFPLCVIGYVLFLPSAKNTRPWPGRTGSAVLACGALALLAAGAVTLLATAGQSLLPPIMQGNRYTPAMIFVVSSAWCFSAVALVMLWRQPKRSVMDLWLMVVMCAWLFDMALSAVLNAGRFDLGFYAGRLYGLLAASFVLVVLLLENGRLYAQLAAAHEREHQKNADLQHLNDELASANTLLGDFNEQLQRAGRFRAEFLAHMSHELRTPLNAIIGFSDLLKDGLAGPMLERQQRYAGLIHQSGHHLLSLINDVLDLSKVEAGKMSLDLERFEPNEFLASCLATFDEARQRRGLQLQLQRLPGQPPVLVADARKLRQLVYNLVSNAIKFTPDGGRITLSAQRVGPEGLKLDDVGGRSTRVLALPDQGAAEAVDTRQVDGRTLYLEIRVSDSGSGMRGEDLPQLFEAFKQLKSTDGKQAMGTGLGLALVSRFAALHGGTVGVASAPGQGTTFVVWIPWRQHAEQAVAAAGTTGIRSKASDVVAPEPPAQRHALVIEDDAAAAELLKLHLESGGFRVSVVADGDGLMQFVNPPPDVITLDILLPGAGGWAVLEQIKNNPALTAVPVVIVSVVPDQQRGFALGASTVLQKPVTRRALLQAVEAAGLDRPTNRPHRVLVVDDDPNAVELVASSLESGAQADLQAGKREVLRAFDGASAISMAREAQPDLIVLDLMMPGVSGFDVVDAVRQQPELAATPILVMTAKTLSPAERERLNGRVLQIVAKESFDQHGFLSEVQRALQGHGRSGQPVPA